jgi:mRNA-degrading endonuclease toxin of MazEF toxin-antitoxin module
LRKVCVASCLNVLTVDQARLLRTVGYLSDAVMGQISDCLKTVLALP